MKVSIEQVLQISEELLRTFVESETVVNLYHGYDRTEEDGRKEGKRVGVVYDVQSLIVGLADLLQKYPDIEVVQHDNYLSITGEPKTSSRNV